MQCPNCSTQLTMSERQGIEIDYCPACRGVWLDRGELDKIIERNSAQTSSAPIGAHAPQQPQWNSPGCGPDYEPRYRHGKRRKSFLEELFD
jgi:Zn-finger nucleic acid-binding protein